MLHQLAFARLQRLLRTHAREAAVPIDDLAPLAVAAGLSLVQASLLLDADPHWQRVFLDEDGFVVAARGARDDDTVSAPCQVVWRRLGGNGRPLAA